MEIYLVRHTTPLIKKDICYGQTDVLADDAFFIPQAEKIKNCLPDETSAIYSSPLSRCSRLSLYLQKEKFSETKIEYCQSLKEMNFGVWENKRWNDLDQGQLHDWMNDFVNKRAPDGESYKELYERSVNLFAQIPEKEDPVIIVTHSGVIRSILSYITQTALADSFASFKPEYGSLVRINCAGKASYTMLHNDSDPII